MDLVDTLRNKIQALGDEECVPGLKAVLLHIETAFRHLSRGQENGEDTAFTDSIYRTNQAFEGSVKEAYRVLADKDPGRKNPYEIETYLEKNGVFKPRVLSQLTTYRTEWRNPSTHDYKLNFDESEAFLAIISVSAFSCLLLDQITDRVEFRGVDVSFESLIPVPVMSDGLHLLPAFAAQSQYFVPIVGISTADDPGRMLGHRILAEGEVEAIS